MVKITKSNGLQKHCNDNKRKENTNPTKTKDELRYSGRIKCSCQSDRLSLSVITLFYPSFTQLQKQPGQTKYSCRLISPSLYALNQKFKRRIYVCNKLTHGNPVWINQYTLLRICNKKSCQLRTINRKMKGKKVRNILFIN